MKSSLPIRWLFSFFVAILLSFFVSAPASANFALDTTFGTAGKTLTSFGNNASILTVTQQADGKSIGGGFISNGSYRDWTLVRYTASGVLDTTFGVNGVVTKDFGYGSAIHKVLILSDGKILAVGTDQWDSGPYYWTLARYNIDGSIDTTFGTNGYITDLPNGFHAILLDATVQTDNKIVTVGYVPDNHFFVVGRYNADGSIDTTYGSNGFVFTQYNNALFSRANAVALQIDGKIVVFGEYTQTGPASLLTLRYNTDGTIDTTFGTNGAVEEYFGYHHSAVGVAIDATGKIITTGYFSYIDSSGTTTHTYVIRYNADGTHDTTFGISGYVINPFGSYDHALALALQSDGKVVIGGEILQGSTHNSILSRFNMDGSLDTTFDASGSIILPLSIGYNDIEALALQLDGKIVGAGTASNGSITDMVIERYAEGVVVTPTPTPTVTPSPTLTPTPTPIVPIDINQCKNGGWMSFINPTFKNQGACVSFVTHR